jgi:hypothetical protein
MSALSSYEIEVPSKRKSINVLAFKQICTFPAQNITQFALRLAPVQN